MTMTSTAMDSAASATTTKTPTSASPAPARSGAAGAGIARARYEDRAGHPVVFDRSTWAELATIKGDIGARVLLRTLDVTDVPVPGRCPPDVDRPQDLAGEPPVGE